jgi:hypothetical protein
MKYINASNFEIDDCVLVCHSVLKPIQHQHLQYNLLHAFFNLNSNIMDFLTFFMYLLHQVTSYELMLNTGLENLSSQSLQGSLLFVRSNPRNLHTPQVAVFLRSRERGNWWLFHSSLHLTLTDNSADTYMHLCVGDCDGSQTETKFKLVVLRRLSV